jgi:hypothetical protein
VQPKDIVIATPALAEASNGNWQTAYRRAGMPRAAMASVWWRPAVAAKTQPSCGRD